jgi:hypothetical protein
MRRGGDGGSSPPRGRRPGADNGAVRRIRQRRRRAAEWFALLAWAAASFAGRSVEAQPGRTVILHEYFEPPEVGTSPGVGESPRDDAAETIVYTAEGPDNPEGSGLDRPGARNGPQEALGELGLDRDTDREGWLSYYAAFDPTVAPFKRVGVRDQVVERDGQLRITVGDPALRMVSVVPHEPASGDEVFWGRVVVELSEGAFVPIPSVAADMAIHEIRTEPEAVALDVFRDGAHNYYVRGDYDGRLRVHYRVSASPRYFGGPLPGDGTIADLPAWARVEVPESALEPAWELWEQLHLDPGMPASEIVAKAAGYFRGFVAEPSPQEGRSEDIYRDVLFGRRGVCRHRTFAFVVTTQAWGIPSRYVYNEAHAFAEAYLPRIGWRRVDLGGGAEGLRVLDAASQVLHAPVGGDPLPVPDEYRRNYSRRIQDEMLTTNVERRRRREAEEMDDEASSEGTPEAVEWDEFGDSSETLADLPRSAEAPLESAPAPADPPIDPAEPPRRATRLQLLEMPEVGFRGETMRVRGRLVDESGAALAGRRVTVYLGPADGREDGRVIALDEAETGNEGEIDDEVMLPQSLPLGVWGIYLVYRGDDETAPCRSD